MTFDKPTFVKPDSAIINNLEYSDIYIQGLKIGTLSKTEGMYHLSVMFNEYVLKSSDKSKIILTIELEYSRLVFHVLSSVGKVDIDKWKASIDDFDKQRNKLSTNNDLKIME